MRRLQFAPCVESSSRGSVCIARLTLSRKEEEQEHEEKKAAILENWKPPFLSLSLYCEESTAQVSGSHGWNKENVRVRVCVPTNKAREAEIERDANMRERMKISLKGTILSSRF